MQCLNDKLKAYHIAGSKLAPALGVSLLEQCAVVTYGKDLQSAQHMNQAQSDPIAECRQPMKTRHTRTVGEAKQFTSTASGSCGLTWPNSTYQTSYHIALQK